MEKYINNKYEIVSFINSGNFGNIYKVKYKNKVYAIKESINLAPLKYETYVCNELRNIKNITKIYDFFIFNNKYFLVMDYYNKNLYDFKEKNINSSNYYNTIISIIKKTITIINYIHDAEYLHRDIKPLNICLNTSNEPFLIDFGISKKYIENRVHIDCKQIKTIIGSYAFCSINIENLLEPSRRDDIESIFYVLIFCLLKKEKEQELLNIKYNIKLLKNFILIDDINIFNNIEKIYNYIRKMSFKQKPNYIYLIELLDFITL